MSDIKYGVAWKSSYELGNEAVDSQHRMLFELVSGLVSSCMDGTDVTKLSETLGFLANYTVKHFEDEEGLQVSCGYPDYERHKGIHEDFKATVGELAAKFEQNESPEELSADVNKIVVRWLVNHIQREDKRIGEFIRNKSAD